MRCCAGALGGHTALHRRLAVCASAPTCVRAQSKRHTLQASIRARPKTHGRRSFSRSTFARVPLRGGRRTDRGCAQRRLLWRFGCNLDARDVDQLLNCYRGCDDLLTHHVLKCRTTRPQPHSSSPRLLCQPLSTLPMASLKNIQIDAKATQHDVSTSGKVGDRSFSVKSKLNANLADGWTARLTLTDKTASAVRGSRRCAPSRAIACVH